MSHQFDEVIEEHKTMMLRLCYMYMKKKEYAEDAFQESAIKIYKNLHSFQGNSTLKTWITRITINTCKDLLRSQWFKRIFLKAEIDYDYYTIDEVILHNEEKQHLLNEISALPSTYKDIILLHYYEELSIKEISAIIQIPESRVKNRLFRGRKMIKEELLNKEVIADER